MTALTTAPSADGDDGAPGMGVLVHAHDWAATPLGPPETWPQSLRTVVRILLSSRYAMWMGWGPALTFLYNDTYGRMTLGAKHPWALGRPANEVWAEIWPDIGPRIQRVLETGEATWDEGLLLILERSGYPEETYHTFSYSPLADDAGAIAGMLCVVTEETERVIGERRLRTLRDLAVAVSGVASTEDVCREAARVLASNGADFPFALVTIGDATAAAPQGWSAAARPGAWPVKEVVATGRPLRMTDLAGHGLQLPATPWGARPHEALVLPIRTPGADRAEGSLVAALSPHRPFDEGYRSFLVLVAERIGTALSSVRALEAERQRAAALAEVDRAKTAFFQNVSHEFRTPLTLLLGPLEDVLQETALPEPARAPLETAHRNGLRLLRLVNALLDFSRIEASRSRAAFEPTDLATLTTDLTSVFRAATDRAGLTLQVEAPPLPAPVYVDPQMWETILLNLLSNAYKFTFTGGITVSLAAEADAGGPRHAVLRVRDTGTGIPAAELPHLFERFHRVEGARGRTHEGTGIGLALVRELVRLHGGRIDVESTYEADGDGPPGTTFTVRIPFGTAHVPPAAGTEPPAQPAPALARTAFVEETLRWLPEPGAAPAPEAASQKARDPARADTRPRVLVADDNADMRAYVRRLLEDRFRVEVVTDGQAALSAALRERPDLVLTDVMMPGLDGFGLLQALREDAALRDVPVVMLSARAGEEARVEGLRAGADDYLIKPFTAAELRARIASTLETGRLRRDLTRQERVARVAAETAAARTERLQAVTAALSAALTPEEIADVMIGEALPAFGGYAGGFVVVRPETGMAEVIRAVGYPPDVLDPFTRFPLTASLPVCEAIRTGEPVWMASPQDAARYGEITAALERTHSQALAAIPLRVDGRVLAAMTISFRSPRAFDDAERAFALALAGQCAQALERARLYEAERDGRVRFRLLADALPQIVWELDAQGHTTFINRRFFAYTGLDRDATPAQRWACIHPGDAPAARAAFDDALTGAQAYNVEYRLRRHDGAYRWHLARGTRIAEAGLWYVTATDIEDLKAAETTLRDSARRAAFRAALADTLRPLEDPVAVQGEAARLLGGHLGADRVFYSEIEDDGEYVVVARDFTNGVASVAGRHALDSFGPTLGAQFRAGRTIAVGDTTGGDRLTDAERAAYEAVGVRAFIAVPLLKGGRFVAMLGVHQARPRAWTDTEVALVEETAERTWGAVARARAEASLRESEARYRTLFTSIDEGFCVCEMLVDADGHPVDYRFLEVNDVFGEMTGIGPDAVGRTARALVPDLEDAWVQTYARAALGGESLRFENGSPAMGRWFNVYATPVGPEGSRRFAIVFTDVTEQRRAQKAVEAERQHLYAALMQAPAAINVFRGPDHTFEFVNARFTEITGLRDIVGKTVREAQPELDGQGFYELLDRVYATGEPFVGHAIPVHIGPTPRYFDITYQAIRDVEGRIAGVLSHAAEVTEQVQARERLRALLEQAPVAIAVLNGPDHVFEVANATYRALLPGRDFTGRSAAEVFPELAGGPLFDRLDTVYRTGEAFVATDYPVSFSREPGRPPEPSVWNFIYAPFKEGGRTTGVLVIASETADQGPGRPAPHGDGPPDPAA